MINYSEFFPNTPNGEQWQFRYRRGKGGNTVDDITLLYKTRKDNERLEISLDQNDGPLLVGMFDRIALSANTLELLRIQVPEDVHFHEINPPFSITPDPNVKDQVERMLPDVVLAAFCEPPHVNSHPYRANSFSP